MSKHTPPLYALLPITDTEGLEDNKPVYGLLQFANIRHLMDNKATHYLRPLPEGTVAVSEEELKELLDKVRDMPEQAGSHEINQFIKTKLAQMGE